MFDGDAVQYGYPVLWFGEPRRAAIEPRAAAVGEFDIAASVGDDSGANGQRLLQQRPGTALACVDRVAQQEVAQLFAAEAHPRTNSVRRERGGEWLTQHSGGRELEHAACSLHCQHHQPRQQTGVAGVDHHPFGPRPLKWSGHTWPDDDVAPEHGWATPEMNNLVSRNAWWLGDIDDSLTDSLTDSLDDSLAAGSLPALADLIGRRVLASAVHAGNGPSAR
ncbi:unannotated protein [freshwater metagenome]|uniref:Unannotated protein n=1 Tax=freshwater metagenome TaxID=449393 RepID=A0A6J7ADR5_9ZZZZ